MRLLDFAKLFIKEKIQSDSTVIDFTMGNGNDTAFLCSMVPAGKVYAFDIQKEALENTKKLLSGNGYNNAELILDSHANVLQYVHEKIDCGMFNLGYRPCGDKNVHTLCDSTKKAVLDGISLLSDGGIIVISIYPGHDEGTKEGNMLIDILSEFDKKKYAVMCHRMINSPDSPFIITVEKYKK